MAKKTISYEERSAAQDKIGDLMRAFENYREARESHDKAFAGCSGSWGYFGQGYVDDLDQSMIDLVAAMDKYIDARIARSPRIVVSDGVPQ